MNRALPGTMTDLIRDGVHPGELKARGDRAVWSALFRTAASAMQRGIPRVEWIAMVTDPRSRLGGQAAIKKGRAARSQLDYERLLNKAWTKAAEWVAASPAPFDVIEIVARIREVRERVDDRNCILTDVEKKILRYACDFAESKMTDRPALPWRAVVAETKLTERVVKTAMASMAESGLLRLEVRGRSGGEASKRRASLYRLPDAARIPVPVNGSMGPSAQVYGTFDDALYGTSEQVYGTSLPDNVTPMRGRRAS